MCESSNEHRRHLMVPFDRDLWRMASRLAERMAMYFAKTDLPDLDEFTWSKIRILRRRLRTTASRGWNSATTQVRRELKQRLNGLQNTISSMLIRLTQHESLREPPSERNIYEELVATRGEFPDFEVDLRAGTVTVTTDTIVLEGITFGRFHIVLQLDQLIDNPYRVVAESPNPSTSRSEVTHPHVSSGRLCEGDASVPLENALRDGRFSDFFQIIQQTLKTYNSDSPYVSIDDWEESVNCSTCGCRVDRDESHYCDNCEATVCSDCSTCCAHCDHSGCVDCVPFCRGCHDSCCNDCLKLCAGCAKARCPSCLIQSLCEACHVEASIEQSEKETDHAGATVQPNGLGQAAVPAGCGQH